MFRKEELKGELDTAGPERIASFSLPHASEGTKSRASNDLAALALGYFSPQTVLLWRDTRGCLEEKAARRKEIQGVIQQPLLFLNSVLLLWRATGISKEGGLQA